MDHFPRTLDFHLHIVRYGGCQTVDWIMLIGCMGTGTGNFFKKSLFFPKKTKLTEPNERITPKATSIQQPGRRIDLKKKKTPSLTPKQKPTTTATTATTTTTTMYEYSSLQLTIAITITMTTMIIDKKSAVLGYR